MTHSAYQPLQLRLAVIGCGRVLERYYLPALHGSADWRLVAAVDSHPDRRRWIEGRVAGLGACQALAQVPSDTPIDAALIASPPESHGAIAAEALRRGMHLLIEKPMTVRLSEAESLLRLAHERGRQIWVGFNRRFRPSYGVLREQLAQLPKERIVSIRYDLCANIANWDAVSDYLGDQERGGGVLDDIGSHQLDLLPWLLDLPVREVSATYEPAAIPRTAISIGLRFAGGLEARCHAGHHGRSVEHLEIQLDHGTLLATRSGLSSTGGLPLGVARRLTAVRDGAVGIGHRLLRQPGLTVRTFRRQLAAWAHAIRSGHSLTAADGAAGAVCVGLVEACRESLALGGAWLPSRSAVGR